MSEVTTDIPAMRRHTRVFVPTPAASERAQHSSTHAPTPVDRARRSQTHARALPRILIVDRACASIPRARRFERAEGHRLALGTR
jgi:hypothetical protein